MSNKDRKQFKASEIPTELLATYIQVVEELFKGKTLSYKHIQDELKYNYGVDVPIERIRSYYEPEEEVLATDEYLQYKNLGLKV